MIRRTAIVVMAALCLALPACQKVDARINKANFDKIKAGMTRDEVVAILGEKYEEDPNLELVQGSGAAAAIGVVDPSSLGSSTPALKWVKWGSDKKYIAICFDRAGKVHSTEASRVSKGLQ